MNNTRLMIALAATSLVVAVAGNPAMAQEKAKPGATTAATPPKPAPPATTPTAAPTKPAPPVTPASAPAKKPEMKDERDRKILVDNKQVLVTENIYKPGASSGAMTERGTRVTRALTDGSLERTYPDGRKETIHWKAGQVRFNPKETFTQKNIGKTELILYTVTIK